VRELTNLFGETLITLRCIKAAFNNFSSFLAKFSIFSPPLQFSA
jgi:hypothetical protein